MAGRKFRIGRHRKNRERKKAKKVIVEDQPLDELKVSLPLTAYIDAAVGSYTHTDRALLATSQ